MNILYKLVFLWSLAGIISSQESDAGSFQKFPHQDNPMTGSDPDASAPQVNSVEEMENAVHQMLGNLDPPAASSPADAVNNHKTAEPTVNNEMPEAISKEESSNFIDEKQSKAGVQEKKEGTSAENAAQKATKPPSPTREEGKSKKGGKKSKSKKKGNHLDGLLNVAKQFLGQDNNDPTLDIIVNMASAYMNSGSPKGGKDDSLSSLIQLASLFGGQKSEGNMLEMLGSFLGDSDFNFNNILQLGSNLLADPGKKGSFSDVIIAYIASFLDMDPQLLSNYLNAFNSMVEANSWSEINSILRRNIGTSAEDLFNLIENDDIREGMAENLISTVVTGIHNFADPANLNMKLLFINGFLAQNKYPIIDPKNIIETASTVIDRLVKDYLGYQIGTKAFFKTTENNLKFLLRIDTNEEFDIRNYTKEELVNSAKLSVKTEVFDTVAKLWSDFKLASENPQCARTILCLSNLPLTVRSPLGLKAAVTRGASTVMAWALSKTGENSMPPFNALYQASWDGALEVDCMLKFNENCRSILKGPKPLMQLDFEHHEL